MLVSGVAAGIAAGIAFGGDWRRLGTFTLRWWPLLVIASALRAWTLLFPHADLAIYLAGLFGVGVVAAINWRVFGAAIIAVGTFANFVVTALNRGMPFDVPSAQAVGAPTPNDTLHIVLDSGARLAFLADVIPFGVGHAVYSAGDVLIAFGGFLIPFVWLQEEADPRSQTVRSANFAFFWLAQAISRFGDPITLIALAFVTYRATQSAVLTAFAVGAATIPNALFSFVGGALADALGPRRAMFWCDVSRAALIGAIPILLIFDAPLVAVLAVAFVAGIGGAVFAPARTAVIPSLLRRQDLARGNSLVFATDRAVEIAGALAGGALVATIGEGAFYFDALTFALSAVLLARVVLREQRRAITWSKVWREAEDAMRFLRRSSVLWSNTMFSLIALSANPVVNTLTPVFLIRRFAGNDPVAGSVLFAGSEAAIAVGAVAGSALLPRYLDRVPKGQSLIVGFAATGLTVIAIANASTYLAAGALFVVLGFTNVLFFVPTVTIVQEATPHELTARVVGARIAITNLSWLPIIFLGGVVADAIGVHVLFGIAGAITFAAAVVAAFIPAIRDVP